MGVNRGLHSYLDLDLLFVDRVNIISHIEITPIEALSDHIIVRAFLGFRLPSPSPQSTNHSSSTIPNFDTGRRTGLPTGTQSTRSAGMT